MYDYAEHDAREWQACLAEAEDGRPQATDEARRAMTVWTAAHAEATWDAEIPW